jgi:hypothetical protein
MRMNFSNCGALPSRGLSATGTSIAVSRAVVVREPKTDACDDSHRSAKVLVAEGSLCHSVAPRDMRSS